MQITANETVLLVEDNPDDVYFTLQAFKEVGLPNPVKHIDNGDEAMDYLFRQKQYDSSEKSPRPGMILLDLNLPGTDGRKILAQIKKDLNLARIPVIVLTSSDDERDIEHCYKNGADSYIIKPVEMDGFVKALRRLKKDWFITAFGLTKDV